MEEALARIRLRPRPLAVYYFGDDGVEIERVTRDTACGGLVINDVMMLIDIGGLVRPPFGKRIARLMKMQIRR